MQITLMLPDRLERSWDEQRRILARIRSRDGAAARQAAHEHLAGARDAALERLEAERIAAQGVGPRAPR